VKRFFFYEVKVSGGCWETIKVRENLEGEVVESHLQRTSLKNTFGASEKTVLTLGRQTREASGPPAWPGAGVGHGCPKNQPQKA